MSLSKHESVDRGRVRAGSGQVIVSGMIGPAGDEIHDGEAVPSLAMRTDILALICPDWRPASLVLDGRSGQVTYANTPCLQMLDDRETLRLVGGRISFASQRLTERFYAVLDRMLASGLENAALVDRDANGSTLSIMMRNMQGFFRDVLDRSMGRAGDSAPLIIVELAASSDQADWNAFCAFCQMFQLQAAEADVVDLLVRGLSVREIADLKRVPGSEIRQHLKMALKKTHCRHQGQLVRLVMTLCPPMRRP